MNKELIVILDNTDNYEYSLHLISQSNDDIVYNNNIRMALQMYAQYSLLPHTVVCAITEDISQLQFKQYIKAYMDMETGNTVYFISDKALEWCENIDYRFDSIESGISILLSNANIRYELDICEVIHDICNGSWSKIISIISGIPTNTTLDIINMGKYFDNNEVISPYELLNTLCWQNNFKAFVYKLYRQKHSKHLLLYLRKVFTNAVLDPENKVRQSLGYDKCVALYKASTDAYTIKDLIPKLLLTGVLQYYAKESQ